MDFGDKRSMWVVLVPHCALNQNARLARCAERPAAVTELVAGLMSRQIGIIQMPCPELLVLGLDRTHVQIRSAMEPRPVRVAVRKMAAELAFQVGQYKSCGVRVLGIIGKDGSPSCGYNRTSGIRDGQYTQLIGQGVFVEELSAELAAQGLTVNWAGMDDSKPDEILAIVDQWMQ